MEDRIINFEDYDNVAMRQSLSEKMVLNETARLVSKKSSMDAEYENTERMLLLNQTYQERQKQYLVLLALFILIFLICLVIVFMQERLGMTSIVMDSALVLVICIGGVSAYFVYMNILKRDKLNFSKINEIGLMQPAEIIAAAHDPEAAAKGDISMITLNSCVGAACCGPGFVYDDSTLTCQNQTPAPTPTNYYLQ
jgi:hypothetical protein